jgi:hypothetical protein
MEIIIGLDIRIRVLGIVKSSRYSEGRRGHGSVWERRRFLHCLVDGIDRGAGFNLVGVFALI